MKTYEILTDELFKKNNKDFSKCEGLWKEIDEKKAFDFIKSAKQVADAMNDDRPYLEEESAREILNSGELILLPLFWIREKNNNPKCPLCGKSYTKYFAISRIDNETKICSKCGEKEAYRDLCKTVDI